MSKDEIIIEVLNNVVNNVKEDRDHYYPCKVFPEAKIYCTSEYRDGNSINFAITRYSISYSENKIAHVISLNSPIQINIFSTGIVRIYDSDNEYNEILRTKDEFFNLLIKYDLFIKYETTQEIAELLKKDSYTNYNIYFDCIE